MSFTGNFVCNSFLSGILNGDFDFDTGTTDVFKLALYTNDATLNAETAAYTTTGEVSAAGYTSGGVVIAPTKGIGNVSTSGGTSFVTFANITVSSSLTARGALIYKNSGAAICVLDFGSDKTSVTTFQIGFPTANATAALIRLS